MTTVHDPVQPGEILLEEFLKPIGVSRYRLARAVDVPPRRINEIVHGKRGVSPDTALRLSRAFGTSDRFWLTCRRATTSRWRSLAHEEELSRITLLKTGRPQPDNSDVSVSRAQYAQPL